MPNDPSNVNSMQAGLGLMPGWTPPQPMFVPPAMAAQQMQAQASQQISAAASMTRMPAMAPASMFGQQFQQQFQGIQAQQSFNPFVAQSLGGGGYQQGMMPSPLMMTPPSTGVFRPPPQMQMGAIPQQQIAPMMPSPFSAQLPAPMFQTAWDREMQQRDMRADKIYSMISQGPRMAGMGAGIGAGALAGAGVGGMFGPMGRLAGAVGGGALAGISGFAGGVGDAAMGPMRPGIEVHAMGASLQRMSQQWMLSGPQMHQQGAGFSRQASLDMGAQIRSLAGDRTFRNETGGGFNREDLMKITEQSGRAGLMDMEQGTEAVRNNLRQVSRVIKRFMALTGDPDVTSVIREMGQMRAFGMSVNDMERAAQNMKTFARAAGVSIQGLQQMGGLPGAMTYQGAGLSAATGMEMGNYAFAAARQAVATGTFEPRDLARLGGVSGISQRNVQAQAALASMPLFGAAAGGYGKGGWDVNYGNLAQMSRGGQGAQGMVLGAVQNMGQAMAQGGIGALAEYQLRQGHMQDEAAAAMHPAVQMAMRFKLAQQTGKSLGLTGKAAFMTGSRALYGDEVAEQMLMEAKNPQAFREQAAMLRRQNEDIARQQRASIMASAPGTLDILGSKLGITTSDRGVFTGGGSIGNKLSDLGTDFLNNPLFHYMEDAEAKKRGERIERVSSMYSVDTEVQKQAIVKASRGGNLDAVISRARKGARESSSWLRNQSTLMMANTQAGNAEAWLEDMSSTGSLVSGIIGGVASLVPITKPAGALLEGASAVAGIQGQAGFHATQMRDRMGSASWAKLDAQADTNTTQAITMMRASRNITAASVGKSIKTAAGAAGVSEDKIHIAKNSAVQLLVKAAKDRLSVVGLSGQLGADDVRNAVSASLGAALGVNGAKKAMQEMGADGSLNEFMGSVMREAKNVGGQEVASAFKKMEESAFDRLSGGMSGKALKESLEKGIRGYEEMADWGEEGDVGAQEIRGKVKSYSEEEFLGVASHATADVGKKEKIWQRANALGVKDRTAWEMSGEERFGGLTGEGKTALRALAGATSADQLGGFHEKSMARGAIGMSERGANRLGKSLGIVGLGDMTDEQRAGALSDTGTLAKLSKMGRGDLTGLLQKYNKATRSARAGILREINASMMESYGAGDTSEALGEAEGEQAKQNEGAAQTLEGLAETLQDAGFDDFKEGAKDFVEGAKRLREAMDSDMIQRALGETK